MLIACTEKCINQLIYTNFAAVELPCTKPPDWTRKTLLNVNKFLINLTDMKKLLPAIIACLAFCTTGNAQEVMLGYCNGEINTTVNKEFGSTEKDAWMSAAIFLPASDVNIYAGNTITNIRVGLSQLLNIDELQVWVRSTLDGDNLAQGTITSFKRGWNIVMLDEPFPLDGQIVEGIYVGYSYHQKSTNYGMSLLDRPYAHALYYKEAGQPWTDRSAEGTLCLEAQVDGDHMPQLNLRLVGITTPQYYSLTLGSMTFDGVVRNEALQTVSGFDVAVTFDGAAETVYTAHIDMQLAYKEEKTFSFIIRPDVLTEKQKGRVATVSITRLNEGDDENMENNTLSTTFDVVVADFRHRVLLEEFTTESCPNCPRVSNMIHDLMERSEYRDDVIMMTHHSGYYTDWLTIPADQSYTWYYNDGGSVYAPATMVDRLTDTGEKSPVFFPQMEYLLTAALDYRLAEPAHVSVGVEATIDSVAGKINVVVAGSRTIETEQLFRSSGRITVYLVEDGIESYKQAGASGKWIHNGVSRDVNQTWGTVIHWQDEDYRYTCSFDLKDDYVAQNLRVVAMVFDFDANDATASLVLNANQTVPVVGTTSGIADVSASDVRRADGVYDLTGRRVDASRMHRGIYVVNGRKRVASGF